MSTIELRDIINKHLSRIEDKSFLNAIKTIIESKVSDDIHSLDDYQISRVNSAREQFKKGETIANDELYNEFDQWLSLK